MMNSQRSDVKKVSFIEKGKKIGMNDVIKRNENINNELGASSFNDSDPTLKNCLFGAVTLTKNADFEKYVYSGFGIRFDRRSRFSFPGGGFGQNVLIFGEDMSSSAHIDNKKKDILVLGKGPTQGLEHIITAEKIFSVSFTATNKVMEQIVTYLLMVQKFSNLSQKILKFL